MRGSLIVISAPSGTGKTSLISALVRQDSQLVFSVSHTTRLPRKGEVDGQSYFFVSAPDFARLDAQQVFLESATVFGNQYGTSKTWVNAQLDSGFDVILELDWQGAFQVRGAFPEAVLIFIAPPSMEVLQARLEGRGTNEKRDVNQRLQGARYELSKAQNYDYLVINDTFSDALEQLVMIVRTARLGAKKHKNWLKAF